MQSAWSGLRPLAMDPNAADTASASRTTLSRATPTASSPSQVAADTPRAARSSLGKHLFD